VKFSHSGNPISLKLAVLLPPIIKGFACVLTITVLFIAKIFYTELYYLAKTIKDQ
jgi:hypothetical protein